MIQSVDIKQARYELKFNGKSSQYEHSKAWLLKHPAGFRPIFQPRTINNIYYDNNDLHAFFENLTGISSRAKLRLRWYDDIFNPTKATLELKLRRNLFGWKVSDKVNFGQKKLSIMSWNELGTLLKKQVNHDLALHFATSSLPILMNRYKRDYFMSADKNIRDTLDQNVQFFDQRMGCKMNKKFKNISPDMMIMEVKVDAKNAHLVKNFTKSIYFPRTKNSKYVIGVCSILGY